MKKISPPQNLKEIGQRIRYLRKQSKLTQDEFANKYDLKSAPNLSRYENGQVEPPLSFLTKLSEDSNVTVDWILKGDEKKDPDVIAESTEAYFNEKGEITPEHYKYIVEEAKKAVDRVLELKPLMDHILDEVKKLNLESKLSNKKNKDK